MNVACPECSSVFRVDPAKIPQAGIRARCSICGGIIAIGTHGAIDDEFAAPAPAAVAAPSPTERERATPSWSEPITAPTSVVEPEPVAAAPEPVLAPPQPAVSPPLPTPAWNPVIRPTPPATPAWRESNLPPSRPTPISNPAIGSPSPRRTPAWNEIIAPAASARSTPPHSAVVTATPEEGVRRVTPAMGAPAIAARKEPEPIAEERPAEAAPPLVMSAPPLIDEAPAVMSTPTPVSNESVAAAEPLAVTQPNAAIAAPAATAPESAVPEPRQPTPPSAPAVAASTAPTTRMPTPPMGSTTQRASPPAGTRAASPVPPASAAPPRPRPPINPFLANDPNQKAKRLARALVSDIVTYFPDKHREGVRNGTLKDLFRDEIKKSYEEYVDQMGRSFAESTTHFQDALNDVLAGGKKLF